MSIYYVIGDALVSDQELYEKRLSGTLPASFEDLSRGLELAPIEFSNGKLTLENLSRGFGNSLAQTVPFQEVGIGKPLTIEIRHVYTGKHPKRTMFDDDKDMLITSAMRSGATFDAAPRAINFVKKQVTSKKHFENPAAHETGTALLHYTPALTDKSLLLSLEMGFDDFGDALITQLGTALGNAAGIPLFVSHSAHLLAAGAVTKLTAEIGSKLFDKSPPFKVTEDLHFQRAGSEIPTAGFYLLTHGEVGEGFLREHRVNDDGLLKIDGTPYDGDMPYMIISLDGTRNDQYRDFAPTAASAATLERFFAINSGQEQPLEPILQALKLYSDWSFRRKADELKQKIEQLPADSGDREQHQNEYDALVVNILDSLLKP